MATLSRQSKRKLYDFSYPTATLDELAGNQELLLEILNHPNKEFKKLMRLNSESDMFEDE